MELLIKLMQRLNPKNSLFGRILVWFWMAVTLMIVMAFFIARYFSQSWEISALEDEQLQKVQILQQNVQQLLSRDISVDRALRRVSARGRWNLMAINMSSNELILGFPPPMLNQRARFLSLKDAQHPLLVRTNNMEFVGPFLVTSKKQDYQLFVGRLLRRDQRPTFAFGLALVVFLLTGTIACIAIAWTIAKPIKQLSKLSKDFAAGVIENSDSASSQQLSVRKDELGQLHNDIHDMASNLAKSLSQQKALMANISHELRTPLTRLQLALAMLSPSGEDQMLYAKRIEKDIGVMDVLIGQTLQLAKMSDNNQAQWMQVESVNLHEVLSPVLEDLEFEANASGITLQVNSYENINLPLIRASFVSAIENVTRNAIKFSKDKVKVTIEVQTNALQNIDPQHTISRPHSQNTIADKNPGLKTMLSIVIEDDGEGLSNEQIEHIFEPFYRAPSGKHYQGTGLGLAIAKASVQLHHGEIKAHASQLGGLSLTLLFPIESR
jgi:two-component system sensor histidine kinase CpxA